MNAKKLAIAALGLAAVLATAGAQAHGRDDAQFSITIASPVWLRPAPVVVAAPAAPFDGRFDGRFDGHSAYQRPTRWAGDAIPNRFDRVYEPRRDRDGDGIANYDRHDDRHDARDGRGRSHW
jgi:hypothetical protein